MLPKRLPWPWRVNIRTVSTMVSTTQVRRWRVWEPIRSRTIEP
jgi:hypothetical protein